MKAVPARRALYCLLAFLLDDMMTIYPLDSCVHVLLLLELNLWWKQWEQQHRLPESPYDLLFQKCSVWRVKRCQSSRQSIVIVELCARCSVLSFPPPLLHASHLYFVPALAPAPASTHSASTTICKALSMSMSTVMPKPVYDD